LPEPRPPDRRASWWRRLLAAPRDSVPKTLLVSFAVCLACSLVVSGAAIWLRPISRQHAERERKSRILEMLANQPGLSELLGDVGADALEAHLIDLATGEEVAGVDPATFDPRAAEKERRARWAAVYLVRHEGRVRSILLPIHGRGYGGMIYGYLALEGDANTVAGISFYAHSETPGIGDEITDAAWRSRWRGKRIRDEAGELRLRMASEDEPDAGDGVHRVDAIGGATRSSQGVGNMVRFWMGEDGFGPYLRRFRP
jgi:Na+-transporting NADH:ubiquinone oxidoreductase subunit C